MPRPFAALLALLVAGCESPGSTEADAGERGQHADAGADAAPGEDSAGASAGPAGPGSAPDPMAPGPFPVGVMTVDLYDDSRADPETGRGRWLRTEIWYPAVESARDGPFEVLDLREEARGIDLGDKAEVIEQAHIPRIQLAAVRGAEVERRFAPYPVVFFSHGSNGIRWQSVFYTPHLASHGYVVVAPDHDENTIWNILVDGLDEDSLMASMWKRPDDVRFVTDTVLGYGKDPGHPLHGALDPERIGVTGHSLGGITAMGVPCRDARFKATVLHSPQPLAGWAVGACQGDYPVPSLTLGGTRDETLAYCGQYCGYRDLLQGPQPAYLAEIIDGGHFTFSDICRLDLLQVAEQLHLGKKASHVLTDGCGEQNVPFETAHQAINHYSTAFFNAYLRGSTGSLDYLAPSSDPPLDVVRFHEGPVPDYPEEGGCGACQPF